MMLLDHDIRRCEVCAVLEKLGRRKQPCLVFQFLSPAHRHKRIEYKLCPDWLSEYNQVILACQHGHQTIEADKELTQQVFEILRGEDRLPRSKYSKAL